MDLFDYAPDTLLQWSQRNSRFAYRRRVSPPKRIFQKVDSPSDTLPIHVFSSLTVCFSLPMIARMCCKAFSALPRLYRITRPLA